MLQSWKSPSFTMKGHWLLGWCLCVCVLRVSAVIQTCPQSSCPVIPDHDIDLSPLSGVWETVYYTRAEGEENPDIPRFFNISLCAPLTTPTSCSGSRVCHSEFLQSFQSLGQNCQYEYDSGVKQIRFLFEYSSGLVFGNGNVSVTLVCGRTLGVPEVLQGDPESHAIDILWVTSAACKNSSSLAANHQESKCYHVHPYQDNGLRAKFIDLTELIRPEGYTVTYPERPMSQFVISVCRPLVGIEGCSGSMACLTHKDLGFDSSISPPLNLGTISGESSSLHLDGYLLTAVYSVSVTSGACFDSQSGKGNHTVKVHFLCPVGNEDLGPRITFLDDNLCLMVVHWYTSYACGSAAIQSSGCTLTTSLGMTFDLSGLSFQESVTSDTQLDTSGGRYRYDFQICSDNSLSTGCAPRDQPIRVTQIDSNAVCHVLGVGAGRLRYVDGELSLMFRLGDPCRTNFARTTIINFICPENIESNSSAITFSGEEDCFYQFEWVTPLACGAQTSGVSSCQFESLGSMYSFAPLVGTEDENWIALINDTRDLTQCFMINPCGTLSVSPGTHPHPADYCNARLAPSECAGTSVCQINKDGTFRRLGHFELGKNAQQVHSADSNVITVVGDEASNNMSAVIHYVCKVGDLTTPPIFIGITNDVLYEFHWMTYAACPTGVERGSGCTVRHHSTGFVFNLTTLPVLSFSKGGFQYNVSVCNPLPANQKACPEKNASACQSRGNRHYSLGLANSTLVYEDGTLKLLYTGGQQCHHNGNPHRNTTLIFVCDNTAHTPVINDINEDYCNYVIEVRTKKACPPAYQAHSCLHFANGKTYDFSPLSRASGTGNWEARGRDDSLYYINVCQPLNSVAGCNPLSAVCRVRASGDRKSYTNIALASTANFTSVGSSGKEFNLKYEYKNLGEHACPVVTTTVHMVCNNQSSLSAGPRFVSGGDEANPCDYLFTWETVYACPLQITTSHTCTIQDPTGLTFDLSLLTPPNSTLGSFPVSSPAGHTYYVSVCQPYNRDCKTGDNGTVAVCQIASNKKSYSCGSFNTRLLTYFDGSLKMSFTEGEPCHHNSKKRSVLINFACDQTLADYRGSPHFVSENEDCGYTFDWPTTLVCPPRELECVAGGGRYDLRPLLQQQVWRVRNQGSENSYVIGGCRSLDVTAVTECPQKPWMGACRYRHGDPAGSGSALGYISGDIVEESEGVLMLMYTGGDCRDGKRGMVHVHLQCGSSVGEPTLVDDDPDNCVVRIDWTTIYACPRDVRVTDWFLEDPVTHNRFNLSVLPASLSFPHTSPEGSKYNYTVGLGGKGVPCPRPWKDDSGLSVGACQHTLSDIHNNTHSIHALGYVTANTTLQYVGGQLSVEYLNGDECHHVSKQRKTVVSFVCEPSRKAFLEVYPEVECEYTFAVHTPLVCQEAVDIGVPCVLPGFANLDIFEGLGVMEVWLNHTAVVYLSVCGSLDVSESRLSKCPEGAAACLVNNGGKGVHLGKPSHLSLPKPLERDEGVILNYTAGDDCGRENRYNTRLLLVCNRNIPVGTPEFVSSTDCQFTFRWESINACPIHLTYTNISKDVCTIDDTSSKFVYDFTNLISSEPIATRDPDTDTTYIIQLCGTASTLPPGAVGCNPKDTGICQKGPNKSGQTLVGAAHKFVLTSHTPHTVEVVYSSGAQCDLNRHWSAIVSLQCASRESSQPRPLLLSKDECRLDFVWQNSSFCVGEESCSVVDSNGHTYNFDGLFSQTWTGIVTYSSSHNIGRGGTFTMSVCRNLNPFSTGGSHCSSPSGVCLHSSDNRHLNLGHMTGPPTIQKNTGPGDGSRLTIQAVYSSGDLCNSVSGERYTTTLLLHCAPENSAPILSLSDDSSNCSWTVAMETPLACPPELPSNNTVSECVMSTSEGEFDFTPLGKNLSFVSGDTTYSVCLCKSGKCPAPSIVAMRGGQSKSLGSLDKDSLTVSTVTGGPRITFTNGNSCGSGGKIQSIIFMECNRSADLTKGMLTLQSSLSDECHKYFFWSTPYACVSDEVSCTIAADRGNILYDFSPLHSMGTPWQYQSGDTTYYINICGPIEDRSSLGLEDCGPQSSVCVKSPKGVTSLATTSTQRIQVVGEKVIIRFGSETLPRGHCGSHVTVRMACGLAGVGTFIDPSPNCFINDFYWPTPYACKPQDQAFIGTTCEGIKDSAFAGSLYSFQPTKLRHTTKSYTTRLGNTQYYVNLCGAAPECEMNGETDISVCAEGPESKTLIASYTHQTIMAEGYQLLIQMSWGTSHATVLIKCLLPEAIYIDKPRSGTLRLENVGKHNEHFYYYFVLYTTVGCSFKKPATVPSAATTQVVQAVPASSSSSTAVVLTLVALLLVVAVVLGLIFYKKQRRAAFKHFLEKLIIGKADEPVRYHKVPRENPDEETALMGEDSDSDSSVTVDGEDVGEGGGTKTVKVDIEETPESKQTNSDEEMINL